MMAFIGVRISWLMLARKELLARLAACAESRARPLPGAGGDQFFQMVAVAYQFLVGHLALGNVEIDAEHRYGLALA